MATFTHLEWHGEEVNAIADEAMADGLDLFLEHLLGVSKQLVPIEEKTLLDSGDTDIDRGALEGAVYYNTVYARRQHEELTWRHDPGRQAKYLEQPAHAEAPLLNQLVAARLRETLA
jgi:hypothetical protein